MCVYNIYVSKVLIGNLLYFYWIHTFDHNGQHYTVFPQWYVITCNFTLSYLSWLVWWFSLYVTIHNNHDTMVSSDVHVSKNLSYPHLNSFFYCLSNLWCSIFSWPKLQHNLDYWDNNIFFVFQAIFFIIIICITEMYELGLEKSKIPHRNA